MDSQKRYDSTADCHKKINCSVCNCQYHSGENTCTAKQVAVGPSVRLLLTGYRLRYL